MLRALGLSEREIEGDLKEQPCALLGGQSPRFAMRSLGCEWARDIMHPEFWTNLWLQNARPLIEAGHSVCVEDCRFPNEVAAIKALGGYVIRVRTCEPAPECQHISEMHSLPYDASILNEKADLSVLHARIEGALLQLGVSDD
jgi:hypothetical protein